MDKRNRTMTAETLTFHELARCIATVSEAMINEGFFALKSDFAESTAFRNRHFRSGVFCILLCTKGEMSLSVDHARYDLRRNSLLLLRPGSTVSVYTYRNFAVRCMVFDPAILQYVPIPACDMADLRLKVMQNSVSHLTAGERLRLHRLFFAFLAVAENNPDSARGRIVLQHTIAVLLYTISDLLQRKDHVAMPERLARTRRGEYFCRFIQLLTRYFMQDRSVAFYAEKMNLTPKYLSTVIREVSGKTASQWIDDVIVQEACHRLSSSEHSIQQIAYELNFPNQSFFGVYFKNKTGTSPSSYRLDNARRY